MNTIPRPDIDRLVETYRSYAHAIVAETLKKFPRIDRSEVIGAAELGLVEAANAFDPTRQVLFKTFAFYRIRGAIYDSLRKTGWFSKEPARESAKLRFEAGANDYLRDCSASPSTNTSPRQGLEELNETTTSIVGCYLLSLSSLTQELPDRNPQSPEDRMRGLELDEKVRAALAQLPARNRELLEGYYFRDATLEEIGQKLGLSKSWVSRLHAKSLEMMKDALGRVGITRVAVAGATFSR